MREISNYINAIDRMVEDEKCFCKGVLMSIKKQIEFDPGNFYIYQNLVDRIMEVYQRHKDEKN